MIYDRYRYLWPPRPERAVPQDSLGFYERQGWRAQVKKNGTCTLIFTHGDEVIFKTRHGDADEHKAWTPLPEHRAFFGGLDGWQVYVAELLHSKTPHIKNELYVFDLIVAGGKQLIGWSFADRQSVLTGTMVMLGCRAAARGRAGGGPVGLGAQRVAPYVQLAAPVVAQWDELRAEDEGFVFKDPSAPLAACTTPSANAGWQVKARKPHKNYSF